jgi:acetyltransferase-like isoleucine patch superfamily enzyme
MKRLLRLFFLAIEDYSWNISCRYNFWLFGPYGLSGVIERMPSRFTVKYLKKYGATVGEDCRVEKGINLHRATTKLPFINLTIGNNVYIGHKTKIDLSRKVIIHENVIIGSRCMFWTHASDYKYDNPEKPIYYEKYGEIEIFKNALIYSGVIFSYGVKIGKNAKVGAGSMVYRSIEENAFYSGVPARLIHKII